MTVLHNDDRWEPSNVRLDADVVVSYRKGAPPGSHQYLDYGYLWSLAPPSSTRTPRPSTSAS